MSHYANIGFAVHTDDELNQLVEQAYKAGQPVTSRKGLYVRYLDPSGAELWLQVNERKELVGLNPYFQGDSRVAVEFRESMVDESEYLDGGYYCWANPSASSDPDEPGDFPFVLDFPDFFSNPEFEFPCRKEVGICAFAEELEVFESEEVFDSIQPSEIMMAPESFIPVGLLGEEGELNEMPQAFAVINGRILRSELKNNVLTDQPFWWMHIQTFGAKIDVVASKELISVVPQVGNIVSGTFWLVGRVLD